MPSSKRYYLWLILLAIFLDLGSCRGTASSEKVLIGWLERVYLTQSKVTLKAKMDTGAKNSSLHAEDLQYIDGSENAGHRRVRFKTIDRDGRYQTIEADLVGKARVKKARPLAEGSPAMRTETRPVVVMEICLGGIRKQIQVNLRNRTGMNYRMILGRSALSENFIVDVSQKFIGASQCFKD